MRAAIRPTRDYRCWFEALVERDRFVPARVFGESAVRRVKP
jgi:hypothetical protein